MGIKGVGHDEEALDGQRRKKPQHLSPGVFADAEDAVRAEQGAAFQQAVRSPNIDAVRHEVIPEAGIEESGELGDGQLVEVSAYEHIGPPAQPEGFANEPQFAPTAADLLAELRVGVTSEPGVTAGKIVQHQRVDPTRRAGDLAQGFEVKPHDAGNAAFGEEQLGREQKSLHGKARRLAKAISTASVQTRDQARVSRRVL